MTKCTCDPHPWSYTDPEPMPDQDCPKHGDPAILSGPQTTTRTIERKASGESVSPYTEELHHREWTKLCEDQKDG
ncbi:hypothetical protein [Streptomyces bluensis]|uniref:Uncharacterized protein n=1 Tax=Streptomyces bluensis TaxID=33897 RepID=A0ABW6UY65_9ACTN